jgi:uncharacterized metal-binding protein YceD (DUF177 family)
MDKSVFLPFVLKDASLSLEEFDIEFVKLKDGIHEFNYRLEKKFFEIFGNEDVLGAEIAVRAVLEKTVNLLNLNLEINGWVNLSCDRCLVPLLITMETGHHVLYKMAPEGVQDADLNNDDWVVLTQQDYKINLAQECYETTLLSLPMIRNCDEMETKPCNYQMLSKLNDLNGTDGSQPDPRWDKLKELFKKK